MTQVDIGFVAPFVLLALGIAAMWRLYRMATDPAVRLRDGQGRLIDPDELESDEPPELHREQHG